MTSLIDTNLIQELLTNFSRLYEKSLAQAGVSCPTGCGKCCYSPYVEASPAEFFPLVAHWYQQEGISKLESMLSKLQSNGPCILFDEKKQTCSEYQHRVFVCRAFGLHKSKNKYGEKNISICPKMSGQKLRSIKGDTLTDLPTMMEWKTHFDTHFPPYLCQTMPINQALAECLARFLSVRSHSTYS